MEPISFVAGVIPLFHSCLQYFQLYKTAQSASSDIQYLLFQLDCYHEDLILWGEKHGFFSETHPQVHRETFSRIATALRLLEALFKDSSALRERYGVAVSDDDHGSDTAEQDGAFPSSAGLHRLNWWKTHAEKHHADQGKIQGKASLGVLKKTRWAIYDKEKFEGLIKKIGEIVGQIEKILPIPDEFRNQTALLDIIQSLIKDMDRLKLFQTASASIYPAWSNATSGLIIASEAASVRGPASRIVRWVEQVEDGNETHPDELQPPFAQSGPRVVLAGNAKPASPKFDLQFSSWWSLWFAFLPTCPSSSLGLTCNTVCLELKLDCPAFISNEDYLKKWGLGPKLKSAVKAGRDGKNSIEDIEETFEKVSNIHYELQEKLANLLEPSDDAPPASRIHFYCAPCRCAIRTALILCRQSIAQKSAFVRIDDRIPSICCNSRNVIGQLRSFIATVDAHELDQLDWFPPGSRREDVVFIDKEWIENRVYSLESELYPDEVSEDRLKSFNGFINNLEKGPNVHSVVLLEASGGAWVLQTLPLRKSSLMAKQFELFNYRCKRTRDIFISSDPCFETTGIYRGTFTPSKLNFPKLDFEPPPNKRQRL